MNDNPFEQAQQQQQSASNLEVMPGGEAGTIEAMERAQVDIQISTAKRYPRVIAKVKNDLATYATSDEETAEACFYSLPRGGKAIEGPSVRMAEIAAACYGNLRIATRIVNTVSTGDNPHVTIQCMAHDLERNVAVMMEKRRRITKKRNASAPDEDDIQLATNSCTAIAFRDAIFKVVPGALIKPVFEQCKKIVRGDMKSLVERRTKVMQRLAALGIAEDRVLAKLELKKVDEITLDHVEQLIGAGTMIKEGAVTPEDAFPPVQKEVVKQPEPGKKPVTQPAKQAAAPAPEPAKDTQPEEPEPEKEVETKPAAKPASKPTSTEPTPDSTLDEVVAVIRGKLLTLDFEPVVSEAELMYALQAANVIQNPVKDLDELASTSAKKTRFICKNWAQYIQPITESVSQQRGA